MIYTIGSSGRLTGTWSDYAGKAAKRYAKRWGDTVRSVESDFPALFREGVTRSPDGRFSFSPIEWVDPADLNPFHWGDVIIVASKPETYRYRYKGQWLVGWYDHHHIGDIAEPYDQWEMSRAIACLSKILSYNVGDNALPLDDDAEWILTASEAEIDKFLTDAGGDPEAIGKRGEIAMREFLQRRKEGL